MTPAEKTRIDELRNEGLGYKRIAQAVSLPLSTVKSYCRRHASDHSSDHALEIAESNNAMLSFIDPSADKIDSPATDKIDHPSADKFDSPVKQKSDHPIQDELCKQCGAVLTFHPNKKKRQFCSNLCRQKWWLNHSGTPHICPSCGRTFLTARHQVYCSHDCYIAARFPQASLPTLT